LLRRLALVDQAGREFDAEGFDRRAVLHDDHGADGFARVLENRHDGDGVDARGLAGLARGGFPDALLAVLEWGRKCEWNVVLTSCGDCCFYLVGPLFGIHVSKNLYNQR